jgi:maleylpyruvate isomerase
MAAMPEVDDAVALVRAVQVELVEDLRGRALDPRAPSLLPSWSVGHLLTHLARNADSVVRRLEASAAGIVVAQYEGGPEGRAAEIEDGAARPYGELVDDVEASGARILEVAPSLPAAAWDFETLSVAGERQRALTVLLRRGREVVIHHTDLGIGFTPQRWRPDIVDGLLADALTGLEGRADRAALAGWLVDRSVAPVLRPWG